jgi:hypothetical protein
MAAAGLVVGIIGHQLEPAARNDEHLNAEFRQYMGLVL